MSSGKILALAALCGLAWSQATLTTIQDTLFEADGTHFNGTLAIQWSTFNASLGTVIQQSKTVTVVNGNLLVQLAPNAGIPAPANVYTVTFQSDGYEQYTETWTVPVSAAPLTVSEVQTGSTTTTTTTTSSGGNASSDSPIPESSVIGLQADLNQRPTKGAGFGANGVAVVDGNGILETAVGQFGDCVLVDGTTGPCGAPTFVDAETPGGTIDGVNNTFTLANTPSGTSLMLFRNGIYLTNGFDYNLSGSTIQFVAGAIPQPGDILTASYRVDPSAAGDIASGSAEVVRAPTTAQVVCSAAGGVSGGSAWATLGACDIPASELHPGDRIEIRFSFSHTGPVSGYALQIGWGSTTILARTGSAQDAAVAGTAEAAITSTGAQISVQSWGTVLPFLPGIVNSPAQADVQVALKASLLTPGSDRVSLTNFTVLRYPAN